MKKKLIPLLLLAALLMTGCSSALLTSMFSSLDEMELPDDTDFDYEYTDMHIDLDDYGDEVKVDISKLEESYSRTVKTIADTGEYAFGFNENMVQREDVTSIRIMYVDINSDSTLYYYAGPMRNSDFLYQSVARYNYVTKELTTIVEDSSGDFDHPQFEYASNNDNYVFVFAGKIYRYTFESFDEDTEAQVFGRPDMMDELYEYASNSEYVYDEAICTGIAPLDVDFNNIMIVYMLYASPDANAKKKLTPETVEAPLTKVDLEYAKWKYFEMLRKGIPITTTTTEETSDEIEIPTEESTASRYLVCLANFSNKTGKLIADVTKENALKIASIPSQNAAVFEEADNTYRIYNLNKSALSTETYTSQEIKQLVAIRDSIIAYTNNGVTIFTIVRDTLRPVTSLQYPFTYSVITNSQLYQKTLDDIYLATTDGLVHFWHGANVRDGCYYAVFPGNSIMNVTVGIKDLVEETTTLYSAKGKELSSTTTERKPNFSDIAYAKIHYIS